jgi:hypothetical protein
MVWLKSSVAFYICQPILMTKSPKKSAIFLTNVHIAVKDIIGQTSKYKKASNKEA